jgi:hypothetical protein
MVRVCTIPQALLRTHMIKSVTTISSWHVIDPLLGLIPIIRPTLIHGWHPAAFSHSDENYVLFVDTKITTQASSSHTEYMATHEHTYTHTHTNTNTHARKHTHHILLSPITPCPSHKNPQLSFLKVVRPQERITNSSNAAHRT